MLTRNVDLQCQHVPKAKWWVANTHPSTPPAPSLPSPCCPPGPTVTTWRYGGGRCRGVLSLQNVAAKGAWLAWTTCSPGSLWRGMFNSLIPHPSLLLLLLFLHNLTLNLGFTLGNENYFEGFKIMRMKAWFDYTAVETEGIERKTVYALQIDDFYSGLDSLTGLDRRLMQLLHTKL